MHTLKTYLASYYKSLNKYYFFAALLLLVLLLYINYGQRLQYHLFPVGGHRVVPLFFLKYYVLYLLPWATAFLLQYYFYPQRAFFRNKWFWSILLLAPAMFACRSATNEIHRTWVSACFSYPYVKSWLYAVNWLLRTCLLLTFIFLFWYWKDRQQQPFYGIKRVRPLTPYLYLLLLMLGIVMLAALRSDMTAYYPRARVLSGIPLSSFFHYALFEGAYAFDFLGIEFFFRGFLILSLANIAGYQSIIPAAIFYATVHLSKPFSEAFSSFFGGLILGILSYHTRSVWGGVIIHVGVALGCELFFALLLLIR